MTATSHAVRVLTNEVQTTDNALNSSNERFVALKALTATTGCILQKQCQNIAAKYERIICASRMVHSGKYINVSVTYVENRLLGDNSN
jgi:hypothetical protein